MLALDGQGSAASEALAPDAASRFEREAAAEGAETMTPLSPGIIGWAVPEGRAETFALIDAAPAGVVLTPKGMMGLRVSMSFVLGTCPGPATATRACDLSTLHAICRYQDDSAAQAG